MIVQCLGKAVEAAKGLESMQSQNLRFVLNIASTEAGRVARSIRKSSTARKPASSAKTAAKSARTPAKSAPARSRTISAKPQQKQQSKSSQSRRGSRTINGALAH